ncbi:PP2C family protein-serine/threonine phosphatase [Woodsholea maritima]|uniref:PP2C family protein-serine/threonine phosphatase n=1 Tax=Woodsholea maritima TaxID=240237 RepID=UPI00037939FE|nr:fused response regulator/phosphatase [Woodsholea maritima]
MVVDDLASTRNLIASVLRSAGFSNILFAIDGVDALEKIAAHPPDIIILDLVMPRKSGFEVCQEVREVLKLECPILVQSGLEDNLHRAKAFDVGASDLVIKPINPPELISRIKLHLEKRRVIETLKAYKSRMVDELRTAQAMQRALFKDPDSVERLGTRHGLKIATFFEPSDQIGGDFWDIWSLDEHRLAVLVVDISGHGVSAAINAFRLHMLVQEMSKISCLPAEWLSHMSRFLYEIFPVEHFATAFYGIYDRRTLTMTFAGAGAPSPLVLRQDGAVDICDASGLPLGCIEEASYTNQTISLKPGDCLMLYSDALVEDFDNENEQITDRELGARAQFVRRQIDWRDFPAQFVEGQFGTLEGPWRDDLTLVTLEAE